MPPLNGCWWAAAGAWLIVGYDGNSNYGNVRAVDYKTGSPRWAQYAVATPLQYTQPRNIIVTGGQIWVHYGGNALFYRTDSGDVSALSSGWSQRADLTPNTMDLVFHDGKRFSCTREQGKVGISSDGISFSEIYTPYTDAWGRISSANQRLFFTGYPNKAIELVLSNFVFKTPAIPNLTLANSKTAYPYMKVA